MIGTPGAGDYVQLSPRGSVMVFDDEHLAIWERGGDRQDGVHMTVYFRAREALMQIVPASVVRFYGTTKVYHSGPIYEAVWDRLIQTEKKGDPEKKGVAVLIAIERIEDVARKSLTRL